MIAALAVATAFASARPGLEGAWESADRATVARIAPCPGKTDRLCAVVPGEAGANGTTRSLGRMVLKDLKPSGPGEWRGRYLLGSEALPATLRLHGSKVEMKVCRFVFCQSASYHRLPDSR